ncbi:MAG: tRNA threonylcarbamoyladenosine dehydratase [Clostridia bacterium]|nr:tRNA threonylcarbamoyladenosine dehydratase [Clostridia bacterium]
MMEIFSRTEMLFGKENIEKLKNKKVIVFGIGGVGGYVCEALARTGIGKIDLVDNDTVSESNINRQIIALHSTVGKYKTEVMRERMLDINPSIEVNIFNTFYTPEASNQFDFSNYDYVVDAIDTVSGKIELVLQAQNAGAKIISSMGAGNKIDPCTFKVADIYKTSVCPLARVMRTELKKRGVKKLKVVYSDEIPSNQVNKEEVKGKYVPASCAFIPSVAGLIIASEVIKDLIN